MFSACRKHCYSKAFALGSFRTPHNQGRFPYMNEQSTRFECSKTQCYETQCYFNPVTWMLLKASPEVAPDVFTSMTIETSPQQPCATPMGTACACWGAPYLGNRQCCAATPQRTVYLSAKHSRSLTVYHALTRTGVLPATLHGEQPCNSGSSSTAGHEPQPMAYISPQKAWDAHSNQGILL